VENSLKALRGELAGLRDSTLIGLKIRWERDFRERIEANPAAKPEFGDVWARIEDIQKRKLMVSPPLNALNLQLIGSPHFGYGAQLVRYVQELAKPESERSQQYRGPGLQQIRTALQTAAPVNADLAAMTMRYHLELADAWLEPGSPAHALLFRPRETPETAADRLAATSRILDASFRRQIVDGGVAALESSTDPILVLAREAAARIPALTDEWRAIQAAETVQKQRLARALFAVYGTSLPPDATFTLRISDGRVKGYAYNGTLAPPFTTFHGMWSLSAGFRNEMPWTLPPAFVEAQDRIRMTTPMNFVSTTDITGGNSGSPVIDQQGRVVGLAFDGNIEQLPNEFLFRIETGGRTVSVHSAAIVEALRSIYGADALLRELLGQRTGTGGARQ
jgi:hypothetical protein